MVKYVSHWDASNWRSTVEVMNLQDHQATFTAHVYHSDGSEIITHRSTLAPHADKWIDLNKEIGGREPSKKEWQGLIVIEPEEQGDEFPAMLIICDDKRHYRKGNRFVPFIRIEQKPRGRVAQRQAEAREAVPA